MKKIKTQGEIEKKNKRNVAIISVLMLLLLVISSVGFAFISGPGLSNQNQDSQNQQTSYDKISIQYQGVNLNLLSSYNDIQNISVDSSINAQPYLGKILYIDAKNPGVLQELSSTLGRFSSRVQEVCYGQCKENLPEKNCTDNLIVWKESSENKVYQKENCVFIEGDIRAADAFIYKLFKS